MTYIEILEAGHDAFETDNFEQILVYYTQVIAAADSPNDKSQALTWRGDTYYQWGKDYYNSALADYEEALFFVAENAAALKGKEIIELFNLAKDTNSPEERIAFYTEIIALDSKNAYAYNHRGSAKSKLGYYEAAIEDSNIAIKLNPKEWSFYVNIGMEKHKLGYYEAAIEDCNIAIELNPKEWVSYLIRGMTKGELGHYEAAIEDYDITIELNPKYERTYNIRGIAKYELGYYEAAILDYNIAIELNPKDWKSYLNRGMIKDKLGYYEAAISDYNIVIELNPKHNAAYSNRGATKQHLGNYEAAIADYNRAIELNPKDADSYNNRGCVKANLRKYEEAKADYAFTIELQWDFQPAYKNLATLYQTQHDPFLQSFYNEIVGALYASDMLQKEGKRYEYYMLRGETAERLERYMEALKEYQVALQVAEKEDRKTYPIWLAIGDMLEKIGEDTEAAVCYTQLAADESASRAWDNSAEKALQKLMAKYEAIIQPISLTSGVVREIQQIIAFNIESNSPLLQFTVTLKDIENRTEKRLLYQVFEDGTHDYTCKIEVVLPSKKQDIVISYRNADSEKHKFPDYSRTYHYDYIGKNEIYSKKRMAFIIGNEDYLQSPLGNPINDARAMETTLKDLGFEVFEDKVFVNLTHDDFIKALDRFGKKLYDFDYELALFYYAGHGISAARQNYLVPILDEHAQFNSDDSIGDYCVKINSICRRLKIRGQSICIFDACRNEKFAEAKLSNGIIIYSDFTENNVENENMLMAFATKHHNRASDAHPKMRNGLYTGELIQKLYEPKPLNKLLQEVSANVAYLSHGKQVPVHYPEKAGDFYLKV